MKSVQNFYIENYKMLLTKIKKDLNKLKDTSCCPADGLEDLIELRCPFSPDRSIESIKFQSRSQ